MPDTSIVPLGSQVRYLSTLPTVLATIQATAEALRNRFRSSLDRWTIVRARELYSVTFEAREISSGLTFVIRVTGADAWQNQDWPGASGRILKYKAIESIPSQREESDLTVRIRPRAARTLAHSIRGSDRDQTIHLLTEAQAARRSRQLLDIALGVAELHQHGILHGDLRPDNIAVHRTGATLMDFGAPTPVEFLRGEELIYAAPETLDGHFSTASDVFAFARIASELFKERYPADRLIPGMSLTGAELDYLVVIATRRDPRDRPSMRDVAFLLGAAREPSSGSLIWADAIDRSNSILRPMSNKSATARWLGSYVQYRNSYAHERPRTDSIPNSIYATNPYMLTGTRHRDQQKELDAGYSLAHSTAHGHTAAVSFGEVNRELPKQLDDQWLDRLSESLLIEPVEAMKELNDGEASDHFVARCLAAFRRNVQVSTEVRMAIIASTPLYSEERVADLLVQSFGDNLDLNSLRELGEIVAIIDHQRWLYPAFQFDSQNFRLLPGIQAVQQSFGTSKHAWSTLSWWTSPNLKLNGELPAITLSHSPDSVAEAATSKFA